MPSVRMVRATIVFSMMLADDRDPELDPVADVPARPVQADELDEAARGRREQRQARTSSWTNQSEMSMSSSVMAGQLHARSR